MTVTGFDNCPYCGVWPTHDIRRCPRVAAIEFHANGLIKRIELAPPFHASDVVR